MNAPIDENAGIRVLLDALLESGPEISAAARAIAAHLKIDLAAPLVLDLGDYRPVTVGGERYTAFVSKFEVQSGHLSAAGEYRILIELFGRKR